MVSALSCLGGSNKGNKPTNCHGPPGARPAIRAAAAFPALFSSMKLIVELITSKQTIPTKSCQSGGLPSPLANTMAIKAAASMTHESGFHINPRNFK
ncbi:hypothetical protein Leryth_009463, partial [Lithospermum erythrorhizon]